MAEVNNWQPVAKSADVPEDGTLRVLFRGEPVCLYNVLGTLPQPC